MQARCRRPHTDQAPTLQRYTKRQASVERASGQLRQTPAALAMLSTEECYCSYSPQMRLHNGLNSCDRRLLQTPKQLLQRPRQLLQTTAALSMRSTEECSYKPQMLLHNYIQNHYTTLHYTTLYYTTLQKKALTDHRCCYTTA